MARTSTPPTFSSPFPRSTLPTPAVSLVQIADGQMRWWTVTSGGQLQASVYSDVQFKKASGQYARKPKKHKDKSKKDKKHGKKHKNKHHKYQGGGRNNNNNNALRNEYNGYVNGLNNRGRNHEVVPFEVWASGRYRDHRSSSSSSSSSSSDSDSDGGHRGNRHYRDAGTAYTAPTAPSAPPQENYSYGAAGGTAVSARCRR